MKALCLFIAAILSLGMVVPASSDVIIKKKTTFEGMMGMGGNETNETEYVKFDKSYSDRIVKATGGTMEMAMKGRAREQVQITRIDKGFIWDIDPLEQTYSETPLTTIREMMERAKMESGGNAAAVDSEQVNYDWTVDVKAPQGKEEVNGFECRRLVGTAVGVNKNDPNDRIRITYEYWLGQDITSSKEMEEFYHNYATAVGVDEYQSQQVMNQMARRYAYHFDSLFARIKEVGGYPIRVSMKVEKMSDAIEQRAGDSNNLESEERAQENTTGMTGRVGEMSGKKKSAEASSDGMTPVLSMVTEITSIESRSIDDSKFELPSGYRKR